MKAGKFLDAQIAFILKQAGYSRLICEFTVKHVLLNLPFTIDVNETQE